MNRANKNQVEKFTAILGGINSHQYHNPMYADIWLLDSIYLFIFDKSFLQLFFFFGT